MIRAKDRKVIVVDLDGTLVNSDTLYESIALLASKNVFYLFLFPAWLLRGKAFFKNQVAKRIELTVENLPYNLELIEWLVKERAGGKKLALCSASNIKTVKDVSIHLGIFDFVFASDSLINLSKEKKRDFLVKKFGNKGFDYAGNSNDDIGVWESADKVIAVNTPYSLTKKIKKFSEIHKSFPPKKNSMHVWLKFIRFYQWPKNLLLFLPLIAANKEHLQFVQNLLLNEVEFISTILYSFVSFAFISSSIYIVNDLLDLDHDRFDDFKRNRPFASGEIPISHGIYLSAFLFLFSFFFASKIGLIFILWLSLYAFVSLFYSFYLKKVLFLDCLTLTGLYNFRIFAGASAFSISLSTWFIWFSVFLFLSLAFLKRYTEISSYLIRDQEQVRGRAYRDTDLKVVERFGFISSFFATLTLISFLWFNLEIELVNVQLFFWITMPILLTYWMVWMWFQARKGLVHSDPLIFAFRDKSSLFICFYCFCSILIFTLIGS